MLCRNGEHQDYSVAGRARPSDTYHEAYSQCTHPAERVQQLLAALREREVRRHRHRHLGRAGRAHASLILVRNLVAVLLILRLARMRPVRTSHTLRVVLTHQSFVAYADVGCIGTSPCGLHQTCHETVSICRQNLRTKCVHEYYVPQAQHTRLHVVDGFTAVRAPMTMPVLW